MNNKKGLADFKSAQVSIKLFQVYLVLCEPFEVSHLGHLALKLHEDFLHQRGMYSILLHSLFCMLDQDNTLEVHICMYNRENIDPRYLGLHVHLGVLECSKPNSGISAQACFLVILAKLLKKSKLLLSDHQTRRVHQETWRVHA